MFRRRRQDAADSADSAAPETGSHEVVEYMGTLNSDTHETMNAGVVHDPRTNTWHQRRELADDIDMEEIYADYAQAQEQFTRTANKCLKKLKQPPMEIMSSRSSVIQDWKSVQTSMEKACAALDKASARDKSTTGLSGKFKKCYRSLCNNAGSGNLFVDLIPGDGFGSVLSGGLGIVFNAMEQTGFHREAVYKTLERLPRILDSHVEYTRLASEDKEIHRYTARMYTEIVRTLEHILQWFMMDAFVAGAKHLFKPSGFTTSLNDRLEEVHLAAKDLKTCALQTMWRQTKEMHSESMQQTQEKLDRIESQLASTQLNNNNDYSSSSSRIVSEAAATLDKRLEGLDSRMEKLLGRADSYQDIEVAVYRSLQPLLQGAMKRLIQTHSSSSSSSSLSFCPNRQQQQQAPPPSFLLSPPPRPSSTRKKPTTTTTTTITPHSFLKTLSYNPTLLAKDLGHLHHLSLPSSSSSSSGSVSPPLIHALQRSPRLRAWLAVDESRLLLVNGGGGGGGGGGVGQGQGDMSVSVAVGGIVDALLVQQRDVAGGGGERGGGKETRRVGGRMGSSNRGRVERGGEGGGGARARARRREKGNKGGMGMGMGMGINVIALSFFCGLHRDFRRDKEAGNVSGMVRSLLGQLVDAVMYLDCYTPEEQDELVAECCDGDGGFEDDDDVEGMLEVLARLIWRLPASCVVYLVVDGLEGFATPRGRMEDLVMAVGMLVDLWREAKEEEEEEEEEGGGEGRGATLKFIFTCGGGRARFVEGLFDEEEVLGLPAVPPPSGPGLL